MRLREVVVLLLRAFGCRIGDAFSARRSEPTAPLPTWLNAAKAMIDCDQDDAGNACNACNACNSLFDSFIYADKKGKKDNTRHCINERSS